MQTPWKLFTILAAGFAWLPRTATPAQLSALKVLYVGDSAAPRAEAFRGFLRTNVAKVELANRAGFDPKQALSYDVVLLDWPQGGPSGEFPPKRCPLGEREEWRKPTVLLGSAGLHVAITWKGRGGAG